MLLTLTVITLSIAAIFIFGLIKENGSLVALSIIAAVVVLLFGWVAIGITYPSKQTETHAVGKVFVPDESKVIVYVNGAVLTFTDARTFNHLRDKKETPVTLLQKFNCYGGLIGSDCSIQYEK